VSPRSGPTCPSSVGSGQMRRIVAQAAGKLAASWRMCRGAKPLLPSRSFWARVLICINGSRRRTVFGPINELELQSSRKCPRQPAICASARAAEAVEGDAPAATLSVSKSAAVSPPTQTRGDDAARDCVFEIEHPGDGRAIASRACDCEPSPVEEPFHQPSRQLLRAPPLQSRDDEASRE